MKHNLEALCVTQKKTLSTAGQVFAPLRTPHLPLTGMFTAHKQSPVPHCVHPQAAYKASLVPGSREVSALGRPRLHHPNHCFQQDQNFRVSGRA